MPITRSQLMVSEGVDTAQVQNAGVRVDERIDNQQLKTLISKRNKIENALVRCKTWFESNKTTASVAAIKLRINDFVKLNEQFNLIQSDIEDIDEITSAADQENIRNTFESAYYDLYAELQEAVENATSSNSINNNQSINEIPAVQFSAIRLPPIDIKPFDGTYTEWLPFFNTFSALVHNEPRYNNRNVEKLHQLRNCLKGQALDAIQSLPIDGNNYEVALKLLRDRFENKRLIVQHHVNNIFNMPQVIKDSARSLREFLNILNTNIEALKSLNIEVNSWDPLLIHIMTSKLDFVSRKGWEETLKDTKPPTKTQLIEYLTQRCHLLEALDINKSFTPNTHLKNFKGSNDKHHINRSNTTSSFVAQKKGSATCYVCKGRHYIYFCKQFIDLQVDQRINEVRKLKLCLNCLKASHGVERCKSTVGCNQCEEKHHSLLHKQSTVEPSNVVTTQSANCCQTSISLLSQILLSTAQAGVLDKTGKTQQCRMLLDSGSQSNFIRYSTCENLGLKLRSVNLPIAGINQSQSTIKHTTEIIIKSRVSAYTVKINCLVLDRITHNLPAYTLPKEFIDIPENVQLADEQFYISGPIDILIGAEIFWNLMSVGQIKTKSNAILQKTQLGWIVAGPLSQFPISCNISVCNVSTDDMLEKQLEKFWNLESCTRPATLLNPDEQRCEELFTATTTRTSEGRFQVRIPFKSDNINIGNCKRVALKRFDSLERKFAKDDNLRSAYTKFMCEYSELKHMTYIGKISEFDINATGQYFLPHHAVFKLTDNEPKIRVVFDASAKSETSCSLNDMMLTGPKVQNDIFDIIIRFRTYKYVFSADISKMYRQILIFPEDRKYQRIFWRNNKDSERQIFELNTVTYGTTAAPYLAIRCLRELANINSNAFPNACNVINHDFFVDDVLTGANTISQAKRLRDDLIKVLGKGCFTLSKWAANTPELLPQNVDSENCMIDIKGTESKTLGLVWNTETDSLKYKIDLPENPKRISKRFIVSTIAKIYDPLGLLGPIIIKGKFLIQELWSLQLHWDESVPQHVWNTWMHICKDLPVINGLEISRYLAQLDNTCLEVHVFSDSSEKGYGSCLYVRIPNSDDSFTVNILCAKSRVAPIKSVTLPRLELCSALLGAQLCKLVENALRVNNTVKITKRYFWTDSTIALAWIKSLPCNLKTFVANRVAEIQTLTAVDEWHHVRSADNPADIISRGMMPSQLIESKMWWHGPEFLTKNYNNWPLELSIPSNEQTIPETKKCPVNLATVNLGNDIIHRYSDYYRLIRITALTIKFIQNCKDRIRQTNNKLTQSVMSKREQKVKLTTDELHAALRAIVRSVQRVEFAQEFRALQAGKQIKNTSKLLCLNPFIDEHGLLRVGGRLRKSKLPEFIKNQYILPKNHHFTTLVIKNTHIEHLHAGTQATLAAIREKFWIVAGRSVIRNVLHKCITCFRHNPTVLKQIMGDLPSCRIRECRTFYNTGIDYAGPININENRGRGRPKMTKAYIAVFVCMATKAVHIEVVLNCTTDSFINALKRFMSRRGKPCNIYSDNAKTFIGANKELQDLFESNQFKNLVVDKLHNEGITFKFIPPSAPHMGGVWEAAVKSVKYHLKRVIGQCLLSYEEFQTLLIQIEACLNSRPLTPLSSDPNDLNSLTPGHFLIGAPLTATPEPNLLNIKENRLSRWQHVNKIKQHFWKRWSAEYLRQLQQRPKWKQASEKNLQIGDLVVIKEDNLPPLVWKLGRIVDVHPGADNHVRVATVRTINGVFKRPINKLCLLPVEQCANSGTCVQVTVQCAKRNRQ